jgi:hypothetical protein
MPSLYVGTGTDIRIDCRFMTDFDRTIPSRGLGKKRRYDYRNREVV